MQGMEARMRCLGDVAGIVLRHIEVGTDEDTLAGGFALAQRSEKRMTFMKALAKEKDCANCRSLGRGATSQPQVQRQVDRHAGHDGAQHRLPGALAPENQAAPAAAANSAHPARCSQDGLAS